MEVLLLIDIQKDFLPGRALAVPEGDQVVSVANNLQKSFELVVATQDWHPSDHGSFASNHEGKKPGDKIELEGLEQVLWPDHCIQNAEGAELADDLEKDKIKTVFKKAINPKIDSYSAFYDNGHKRSTGLHEYLQDKEVDTVYLVGLAADVCVKFSADDALQLGYKTYIVQDGTKAIGKEEGFEQTKKELKEKGVEFVNSDEVLVEHTS